MTPPPRPINVYVIEHAKGLLLFGTGQDRASVTDYTYFPGGLAGYLYHRLARFDIGEHDTLTTQLAAFGPPPHCGPEKFAARVRWATNFGGRSGPHSLSALGRTGGVPLRSATHD